MALIFAVYPMGVESAGWIIEGKNTLSFIFYALALLAWLRSDRMGWRWLCFLDSRRPCSPRPPAPPSLSACLAIVWWREGEVRRKDVLHVLPLFGLSAAAAVISVYMQKHQAIGPWQVHPSRS